MLAQHRFMRGHRIGDLPDQTAQLADFERERIDRAARAADARFNAHLDRVDAARHFAYLTRQVGGAARQIGDLVAEVAAVAQPVADGIGEHHGDQRAERDQAGGPRVEPHAEIEHRADRAGDQYHADRDEYGADTNHKTVLGAPVRAP